MKRTPFWILPLSIVIAVAIWGTYWFAVYCSEPSSETRGQFGDMFGALSSLFSGVGFAALIFTILQQKDLIREQGEELEKAAERQTKTIEVLTRQTGILERQTESLEISAAINATTSRIDRYDPQILKFENMAPYTIVNFKGEGTSAATLLNNLRAEQQSLIVELDGLKEKALRRAKQI